MTRRAPILSALIAFVLAAGPAVHAQTPPAIARQATIQTSPLRTVPTARAPLFPSPTLQVNNGETLTPWFGTWLTIAIGGVPGAVAYHVTDLQLGCGFDFAPIAGGSANRGPVWLESYQTSSRQTVLTTDRGGRVYDDGFDPAQIRIVDTNGLAPGADGRVTRSVGGAYGAWRRTPGGFRLDLSQPVTDYSPWMFAPDPVSTAASTCEPKGVVFWKMPDGVWRGVDNATGQATPINEIRRLRYTKSRPFFLKTHQRIVVEETAKLERWGLSATMMGASIGAVCDGKSWGPAGEHAVGVGRASGDLTFTLRSGPVGNRCGIALSGYDLPEGVSVISQNYSLRRIGDQCHLDASAVLPQDVLAGAMMVTWSMVAAADGLIRWIITGERNMSTGFALSRLDYVWKPTRISVGERSGGSVHGWRDPYGFGDPVQRVTSLGKASPQVGLLECNPALSNDNAATLRLERVVLNVPVGLAFDL